MHELNMEERTICYTRICDAKHIKWQEPEVPLWSLAINKTFKQSAVDIKKHIADLLEQGHIIHLIFFLEKAAAQKYLKSDDRMKLYSLLVEVYSRHYHPRHWRLPYLMLQLAHAHQTMNSHEQAQDLLTRAIGLETTEGRHSPFLLAQLHFALGHTHQLRAAYQ
jgi:hypothetical protein